MTTGEALEKKLNLVLSGHPWYARPLSDYLERVTFEIAFEQIPNAGYTIAGLVLHLISWTEEVIDTMNGLPAGTPTSGDWPGTGEPSEEKWIRWQNDLELVNVNLSGIILNFPGDKWDDLITDDRGEEPVVTYTELVEGAIQHIVYHSAQIALLTKLITG